MHHHKSYGLFVYYCQGDDLVSFIEANEGDIARSFKEWSESIAECAKIVLEVRDLIKKCTHNDGTCMIEVDAGGTHIALHPCVKEAADVLDQAEEDGYLISDIEDCKDEECGMYVYEVK